MSPDVADDDLIVACNGPATACASQITDDCDGDAGGDGCVAVDDADGTVGMKKSAGITGKFGKVGNGDADDERRVV